METTEYSREEISDWQELKWTIQDLAGLKIHQFIAWASNDQEIKDLYEQMEHEIMENGNQPKALEHSQEIKTRLMMNTNQKMRRLSIK